MISQHPASNPPVRPTMPEARVMLETLAGGLWFESEAEMRAWKSEPFWRKITGRTAYDRRRKDEKR